MQLDKGDGWLQDPLGWLSKRDCFMSRRGFSLLSYHSFKAFVSLQIKTQYFIQETTRGGLQKRRVKHNFWGVQTVRNWLSLVLTTSTMSMFAFDENQPATSSLHPQGSLDNVAGNEKQCNCAVWVQPRLSLFRGWKPELFKTNGLSIDCDWVIFWTEWT